MPSLIGADHRGLVQVLVTLSRFGEQRGVWGRIRCGTCWRALLGRWGRSAWGVGLVRAAGGGAGHGLVIVGWWAGRRGGSSAWSLRVAWGSGRITPGIWRAASSCLRVGTTTLGADGLPVEAPGRWVMRCPGLSGCWASMRMLGWWASSSGGYLPHPPRIADPLSPGGPYPRRAHVSRYGAGQRPRLTT